MKRLLRAFSIVIALFAGFCVWYAIAADYDYGALAGTYNYKTVDIVCTLELHKDGTFHEVLKDARGSRTADGSWRRFGEASAAFSEAFLRLPGQRNYVERFGPSASPITNLDFGAHFYKILTVYPELGT